MKTKIILICVLLASCLTSHAGRHSSALGGAAIGAIAGVMLGAAIADSNRSCHTTTHTNYVYEPVCHTPCYTERVEVCRPVVETRRVYTQPVRERVVTHYSRPSQCYTEVYRSEPVYQTTQYCSYGY